MFLFFCVVVVAVVVKLVIVMRFLLWSLLVVGVMLLHWFAMLIVASCYKSCPASHVDVRAQKNVQTQTAIDIPRTATSLTKSKHRP